MIMNISILNNLEKRKGHYMKVIQEDSVKVKM